MIMYEEGEFIFIQHIVDCCNNIGKQCITIASLLDALHDRENNAGKIIAQLKLKDINNLFLLEKSVKNILSKTLFPVINNDYDIANNVR